LYVALLLFFLLLFFFFFLCEKKARNREKKDEEEEAQAVRPNASSLVSKQHNAYCIHIQRYKTIGNDDDKKEKESQIARQRKRHFPKKQEIECRSSLADSAVSHH
jgi:flagellar biosynthesis/type III secretory pathway M-ring protein FliF/YscJ